MNLFRIATLFVMAGIALSALGKSAAPQNSATKQAANSDDIPKSLTESVSSTLQFAEGNFLGLAEAMPEEKYSYIPTVGNFDGVRSFGEQVKHVACAQFACCRSLAHYRSLWTASRVPALERHSSAVHTEVRGEDSVNRWSDALSFVALRHPTPYHATALYSTKPMRPKDSQCVRCAAINCQPCDLF